MKRSKKPKVPEVHKPILMGSWRGKDAYVLACKVFFSALAVSLIYFILGMMMTFESTLLRVLMTGSLVIAAMTYLYGMGTKYGESDAAFAEIMYRRNEEGFSIPQEERDHCFHPVKGFFAVVIGMLPLVFMTAVFACLTKPLFYSLGGLPTWTQNLARQNEFGDALQYYANRPSIGWMDIYRILVRAMVMPFIQLASPFGAIAVFWVERISPLLICIAPLGFGFGYQNGLQLRVRVHTGILIGDKKKKQKERREKRQRRNSEESKRLV